MDHRLRRASYEGSMAKVAFLLAQGADPNGVEAKKGFFPLERAAVCDRFAVMEMLVNAGAKIDQQDGPDGLTPLMLAAWDASSYSVKELLRLGADPQAQARDGSVALHYACREGFRGVAEMIMAEGGWSMNRDEWGRAPLDIAIAMTRTPGLVSSMASRSTLGELTEILDVWEPWRLHRLAVAEGKADAGAGLALTAGGWADNPEAAMDRLGEARAVMGRWVERSALDAELPEAKKTPGARL